MLDDQRAVGEGSVGRLELAAHDQPDTVLMDLHMVLMDVRKPR